MPVAVINAVGLNPVISYITHKQQPMRKILMIFLLAATLGASAIDLPLDKYTISRSELPETARDMLNEHFPKAKISMIKVDRHLLKKTDYDVRLVNGTKIEFDNKGNWTSVVCKKGAVPEALLMKKIRKHVDRNFTGQVIVSVHKKFTDFRIGLADGRLLKYDRLGIFKGPINDTDDQTDPAEENT